MTEIKPVAWMVEGDKRTIITDASKQMIGELGIPYSAPLYSGPYPELVAVLKEFVEWYDMLGLCPAKKARALLARIEGEQK